MFVRQNTHTSNMKEQGKKSRFIIERGQISRSDVIESISGKEDVFTFPPLLSKLVIIHTLIGKEEVETVTLQLDSCTTTYYLCIQAFKSEIQKLKTAVDEIKIRLKNYDMC